MSIFMTTIPLNGATPAAPKCVNSPLVRQKIATIFGFALFPRQVPPSNDGLEMGAVRTRDVHPREDGADLSESTGILRIAGRHRAAVAVDTVVLARPFSR